MVASRSYDSRSSNEVSRLVVWSVVTLALTVAFGFLGFGDVLGFPELPGKVLFSICLAAFIVFVVRLIAAFDPLRREYGGADSSMSERI